MREVRYGAAGGLVFAALSVVAGVMLPKPPDPGASATAIGRYFVDHQHRIELSACGAGIAALSLLLLVVYLHERLAAAPFAARLALGGGSVLVTVGVLGALVQGLVAQVAGRLSGTSLVLAFALDRAVFYVAPAFGVVVLMAGVALGARAADLPGWLVGASLLIGAVGLVAGVGQVVSSSTGLSAVGFAGFVLTVVWVAVTSVTLLREPAPDLAVAPVR